MAAYGRRGPPSWSVPCKTPFAGVPSAARIVQAADKFRDLFGKNPPPITVGNPAPVVDLLDPDQYLSARYFGGTAHRDGAMYKKFLNRKVRKYDAEEKAMLELVVLALSAEAKLLSQTEADKADANKIKQGIDHLIDDIACIDCHAFREPDPDVDGPDLTGYGSRQWIIDFVKNPEHEKFYPENNDRMPAFGEKNILTDEEIGLIADWLREDYFIKPEGEAAAH